MKDARINLYLDRESLFLLFDDIDVVDIIIVVVVDIVVTVVLLLQLLLWCCCCCWQWLYVVLLVSISRSIINSAARMSTGGDFGGGTIGIPFPTGRGRGS